MIDNPLNMADPKGNLTNRSTPTFSESIFGVGLTVREENVRTTFQPTLVGLIPIVNETWNQFTIDNRNIGKEMLIEGLRYYAIALQWLRIIQLKQANSQELTQEEKTIMAMCEATTFNVPHPIYVYLEALGNLKCAATGQTLRPSFPPLPIGVINQRGGYYGVLDDDTHNLYEEIASLGVAVEALQTSLSNAPAGNYNSALAPQGLHVNQNLLGYVPLVDRRNEAKNFFLNFGITSEEFAENPANTGFNYNMMARMSKWLSTTNTFKVEKLRFRNFQTHGSQCQTIIERPVVDGVAGAIRNVMGDINSTALMRSSNTTFGVAYYTLFQMLKELAVNAKEAESIRARTWCCVDYTEEIPIPNAWILNRNVRRNIPWEFMANRFATDSINTENKRLCIVLAMVTAKR